MRSEQRVINLPGPQLVEGRDDDIIGKLDELKGKGLTVSMSQLLRDGLRLILSEGSEVCDRLDRVEMLLKSLVSNGVKVGSNIPAKKQTSNPFLNSAP